MKIERGENCQKNIDNKTTIYYYIVNDSKIVKVTYSGELQQKDEKKYKQNDNLKEEQENYKIVDNTYINNEHDKTYRSILSNEKDVTHIINQVLNLDEKIKQEEIEKYNSSFVTSDLNNKEADIVYKIKGRNIFFLIEQQSKVDYSMPYRIQEYRLEIIRSAIDIKKAKTKGYEIPEVIPIVIYTGKGHWNARLNIHTIQDERFKKLNLQKYNLIDINEYGKESLIRSEYLIDKMFLIEKAKGKKELEQAIKEAITSTKDEKDRKKLIRIIQTTLKGKLGEDKIKELIKNEKGENEIMEEVLERVIRYERRQVRKEERKKIVNIITNMLNKGIEVDEIKELTGATKREIEQVKKKIKTV